MSASLTLPDLLATAAPGEIPWKKVATAMQKGFRNEEPVRTAAALAYLVDDLERFAPRDAGLQVFFQGSRSKRLVLDLPSILRGVGLDAVADRIAAVRATAFANNDDMFTAWLAMAENDKFWNAVREISAELSQADLAGALRDWVGKHPGEFDGIVVETVKKKGLLGRLFG